MTDQPPRRLGKYGLREQVGAGVFGKVYKAWDAERQADVALRILDPFLARGDVTLADGYLRAAQAVAALRHPSIAAVLGAGEDQGVCYSAAPFLPGATLTDLIRKEAPMPAGRVVELLAPIAAALDYAHGQGIVHGDVKPGNIILDAQGLPVLVDFGLVDAARNTHFVSLTGRPPCSVEYAAPEQLLTHRAAEVGPSSDVYSLAVVAYQMLTAHLPFEGDTLAVMEAQANAAPPSLRSVNPLVSVAVERVVQQALVKHPHDRPQRAGDFVVRLRSAAARQAAASPWAPLATRLAALVVIAAIVAMPALGRATGRGPLGFLAAAPEPTAAAATASPTAALIALPSFTPVPTATLPAPTATSAPIPTLAPTVTVPPAAPPTRTAAPAPSNTPYIMPATATARLATATAVPPPAPSPTPSPAPTQPARQMPAPALSLPDDGATLGDVSCAPGVPACSPKLVTFVWEWAGPPLSENEAFELRFWPRGSAPDQFYHYGAAAPVRGTRLTIDITSAPGLRAAGGPWASGNTGSYWWTVAVVQVQPYQRSGQEATPRALSVRIVQ